MMSAKLFVVLVYTWVSVFFVTTLMYARHVFMCTVDHTLLWHLWCVCMGCIVRMLFFFFYTRKIHYVMFGVCEFLRACVDYCAAHVYMILVVFVLCACIGLRGLLILLVAHGM